MQETKTMYLQKFIEHFKIETEETIALEAF